MFCLAQMREGRVDTKIKLDKQMGESVETEFTEKWKDL